MLQKDLIVDHVSKKRIVNRGELPRAYVRGAYEAIIDRADFERAQQLVAERATKYSAPNPGARVHVFSGMLVCAKCGKPYMRKIAHGKPSWNCGTFVRKGKSFCHGKQIPEETLMPLVADVLGMTDFDEAVFRSQVDSIIVPMPNAVIFKLADGRVIERTWQDRSRSESWDVAARERASIQGKQRWTK